MATKLTKLTKQEKRKQRETQLRIAANAATREARYAARIAHVLRGRQPGFPLIDARREALVERMRARLVRMVERTQRDVVGAR